MLAWLVYVPRWNSRYSSPSQVGSFAPATVPSLGSPPERPSAKVSLQCVFALRRTAKTTQPTFAKPTPSHVYRSLALIRKLAEELVDRAALRALISSLLEPPQATYRHKLRHVSVGTRKGIDATQVLQHLAKGQPSASVGTDRDHHLVQRASTSISVPES